MNSDLIDESYRQGKVFMSEHILGLIDQGGTPTQIVARVSASMMAFKQTRETRREAALALKTLVDAEVAKG